MKYDVSKSITGIVVRYECPKCKTSLRSSLNKAGKNDVCPDCQTSFVVPGSKERQEHEAQKMEKHWRKKTAKEEREQQKQNLINQKQRESAEGAQRARERLAKKSEHAQHRRDLLAGAVFDPSSHDWSNGGPYVYDCIEIGMHSGEWQSTLRQIINNKAAEGWEYYRSESLVANRPNGCLVSFLGNPTTEFSVVVLVFRKPALVVSKERSVESELR